MTTPPAASVAAPSATPGPARFTTPEFWRMMKSGAFEDIWVELVEGDLHRMPPPGRTHAQWQMEVVLELARFIARKHLLGEVAVDLGNDTVLACDAVVLRHAEGSGAIVLADEVTLAVEVAVSTRDRDLGLKRRLYAAAGIPTYWVIDAERAVIHVFDRPERDDYLGLALVRFGEPLAVPGTDATIVLA